MFPLGQYLGDISLQGNIFFRGGDISLNGMICTTGIHIELGVYSVYLSLKG